MRTPGRGRLNSFDLLPREADDIVAWAAQELAKRERTQTDLYGEFVFRCEALMAEHRGELEFAIPAFSSFHRLSARQAKLTRSMTDVQEIAAVLAEKYDARTADEISVHGPQCRRLGGIRYARLDHRRERGAGGDCACSRHH